MIKKESSLIEEIYLDIKTKIIHGEFPPSMRLEETSLQSIYSCGRSTIREALKQLSGDGLVMFAPYKGASVIRITKEQYIELVQVSAVVEGLACQLITQKKDPNDVKQLEQLLLKTEEAVAQSDILNYLKYSTAFHEYIFTRCGNAYLTETLQKIYLLTSMYTTSPLTIRMDIATQEHRLVYEAICAGDAPKAEQAMRTHLQNGIMAVEGHPNV